MVVALIAIVVIVVLVGKGRARTQADDLAGIGANEFLKAPPTSFPSDAPAPRPEPAPAKAEVPEPAPVVPVVPKAEAPRAEPPTAEAPAAVQADDDDDSDDADDEVVISRFRSPGSRSLGNADLSKPMAAAGPVYHLEGAPEPTPVAEAPTVTAPEAEPPALVEAEADAVIDLVAADAEVAARAGDPVDAGAADDQQVTPWQEVVLAPEPDAVDHVLQALINRARFKQVGVEEVAIELVERSDLQGEEVSDVLASLVGHADADEDQPSSELTLFNDDVPSRPGQLTDFAKLKPADKKRIIVRVLCLLVARSEDQQLPPRVEAGGTKNQSWPLARAVWPVTAGSGDEEDDAPLPSRRLAKSR
ncbi:MAG TPA: hypothetical protein VIJ47_01405 [Acidimicrobiales bacterium]